MELRKVLPVLLIVAITTTGLLTYIALASGDSPSGQSNGHRSGRSEVLVETVQLPGAVLVGAHRGEGPAVLYAYVAYGQRHTTILAYAFRFLGIAEVHNRSLVARAGALNTTWANSDFKFIRHEGRPIGLVMFFRAEGPIYISYQEPYEEYSGYYEVNITLALAAIYHPRLKETVFARLVNGDNSSLLVYDIRGGIVLLAGFKVEGWPDVGPEEGHLALAFAIRLRARSWIGEGTDREKARVVWVSPFCGSTRPKLVGRKCLIRGTFAFPNEALVRTDEGWAEAHAYCLYAVRGFTLALAIAVPKADAVASPVLASRG